MGIFNILLADLPCAVCGDTSSMRVQFQYGATRHYEYKLGDTLRWGGSQQGDERNKNVVVEGIGEQCSKCGTKFLEYDVFVRNNVIKEVLPHDVRYDYAISQEKGYFIVLGD